MVWDEALIGKVGLIAEVQFMRQHGVTKMVRLPATNLTEAYPEANEYVFFARPLIRFVDLIIEAIRLATTFSENLDMISACRTSGKKHGKKFKVVFVPIKSLHCVMRFRVSS